MATSVYMYPSESRLATNESVEEELLASWVRSMETGVAKRTLRSPTSSAGPTVPLACHMMMARDSMARGDQTLWQPTFTSASPVSQAHHQVMPMARSTDQTTQGGTGTVQQVPTKRTLWQQIKTMNPWSQEKLVQNSSSTSYPVPFPQQAHHGQHWASYERGPDAPPAPLLNPHIGSFSHSPLYLTHQIPVKAIQQQFYQQQQQQQQLLGSAQLNPYEGTIAVPATQLFSWLNDAQRSNELLRKESQQRTQGMRDIVDAVNRHLSASDRMMALAARGQGVDLFEGKMHPPTVNEVPRWRQQLVPYIIPDPPQPKTLSRPQPQHQHQTQQPHGLRAELSPQPHHGAQLTGGVSRSGFWQIPESASALFSHQSSSIPSSTKLDSCDIRLASWHLDELDFKAASGEYDSISIVSSLIHHCHLDVLVLTGLGGNGGVAGKVTALLNLWSERKEGGTWRHVACPGSHSAASSAMLWHERRDVRTWDNEGFGADHGLISGLFSFYSLPVLVVTASALKWKDLPSAIDALASGLIKSHHGLVGMHVVIMGPFQHNPSRADSKHLNDHYESLIGSEGHHNMDEQAANIFISRAPYGAKTRDSARMILPVSADGRSGSSARPPFLSGIVQMMEQVARRVRGVGAGGLVWCDLRVKERVQEPPPPSSSSRSALILEEEDLKYKPSSYLEAAKTTSTLTKPSSVGLAGSRVTTSSSGLTKAAGSISSVNQSTGLRREGGLESRW